jgi:ATP-binding cassette subfamily B (MDR/TAP) protein 1
MGAILSGEAAASFFMFTTSKYSPSELGAPTNQLAGLTKARGACNYIFWLRSLVPSVRDEGSHDNSPSNNSPEKEQDQAASLELQNIEFRYPTRPNRPVLTDLNIKVQPSIYKSSIYQE